MPQRENVTPTSIAQFAKGSDYLDLGGLHMSHGTWWRLEREFLKSSYNVFLSALAIVDQVTAEKPYYSMTQVRTISS